jgi:hypothetical protein
MTILAYHDTTFSGLLPCTALALTDDGRIEIRINVTRYGYHRGEVFETSRLDTFPRAHFHRSRRGHFYCTPYKWEDLLPMKTTTETVAKFLVRFSPLSKTDQIFKHEKE